MKLSHLFTITFGVVLVILALYTAGVVLHWQGAAIMAAGLFLIGGAFNSGLRR